MPGMKARYVLSLAFLSAAGVEAAVTAPRPVAAPVAAPAAKSVTGMPLTATEKVAKSSTSQVTVHRCTDPQGNVTLQDEPCPKGSQDEPRTMVRPKDPPIKTASTRVIQAPPALDLFAEQQRQQPQRELVPPPPMYYCTSYDGIERYSESYVPNPRCEPLVLYWPYPNTLTPSQALGCRWVEDSCVRLSDDAACARWREQRKAAFSDLQRSFSDTAAYRKSELARLTQITDESCP